MSLTMHSRKLKFDTPDGSSFASYWAKRSTAKRLARVLTEFPFIDPVGTTPRPYQLTIEATHAISGNKKLSMISGMTKFIVPTREHHAVELEGRLLREGRLLKTYEAAGAYKTKKQLLWLLAPWWWKRSVPGDVTADTMRDLLRQVQRDAEAGFSGLRAP